MMKKKFQNLEQVNSFPEVRALKLVSSHQNIITLLDILL